MADNREDILRKIHQLQKLTEENSGAFQGEVSNASSLIQALMDKYSVSQMEINELENEEIEKGFESADSETIFFTILHWHWMLARAIAKITHTRHYANVKYSSQGVFKTRETRKKTDNLKRKEYSVIAFFGDEVNVKIATELFDEWHLRIDQMCMMSTMEYSDRRKEQMNEDKGEGVFDSYIFKEAYPDPKIYRRSWLDGCLAAIKLKVEEQEENRETEMSTAIKIYKSKVDEAFEDMSSDFFHHKSRTTRSSFSEAGFAAGSQAGNSIELKGQKKIQVKSNLLKG